MIRLAVETSTMTQSVAVEVDGIVVATRRCERPRGHSETLLNTVEGVLADAGYTIDDVNEVICGLGPGSFTGVRIGLSFALGVSAAKGIPLFGVDSMRAFLMFIPTSLPVAVALDARRSEVYGVIYGAHSDRIEEYKAATYPPEVFFAEVARRKDAGIVCVGNGPDAFSEAWAVHATQNQRIHGLNAPLAEGLIYAHKQGWTHAHSDQMLEPRYIRPSDAKKPQSPVAPSV